MEQNQHKIWNLYSKNKDENITISNRTLLIWNVPLDEGNSIGPKLLSLSLSLVGCGRDTLLEEETGVDEGLEVLKLIEPLVVDVVEWRVSRGGLMVDVDDGSIDVGYDDENAGYGGTAGKGGTTTPGLPGTWFTSGP